jgi:phosphoribosylanthranilate isomerase
MGMNLHSARTRVKICGLRRPSEVRVAIEAGADAIGLVFYEKSSRYVSVDDAARLVQDLPPFVVPVGLFVNAPRALVQRACLMIPQLQLQFHGDETALMCESYGRPYLRAARMDAQFDLLDFSARFASAQALLLDAKVEGYGGGGKVFDWSLIPPNVPSPVVLSGGLNPANVVEGVLRVRPWAVDVSSGVESSQGIKDPELIRRFCEAVREADARRDQGDSGY